MSHKASKLVDALPSQNHMDSNDLFINSFGCLARLLKGWQDFLRLLVLCLKTVFWRLHELILKMIRSFFFLGNEKPFTVFFLSRVSYLNNEEINNFWINLFLIQYIMTEMQILCNRMFLRKQNRVRRGEESPVGTFTRPVSEENPDSQCKSEKQKDIWKRVRRAKSWAKQILRNLHNAVHQETSTKRETIEWEKEKTQTLPFTC